MEAMATISSNYLFLEPQFLYKPRVYRFGQMKSKAKKISSRLVSARASPSGFNGGVGEILGDVSVFTASNSESVMIKDLWDQKEGMAVVALLRHFGCPCCWELASTLKDSKPRFDSAGVKLIAVGVGTPNKARILAERGARKLGTKINIRTHTHKRERERVLIVIPAYGAESFQKDPIHFRREIGQVMH